MLTGRLGSSSRGRYLLSEQLVIQPDPVQGADVFAQLQVALAELLDVLAGFGQDAPFTLKEREGGMAGRTSAGQRRPHLWGLTCPVLV